MVRVNQKVCCIFLLLFIISWHFSQMSFVFVLNEVITRFVRDGVLVLALLLPILAGMGLNFAITIGAMCAQVGFIIVIDRQIYGMNGFLLAGLVGVCLAVVVGYLIGYSLNRVKGKEMITTIIMGFLGTAVYQLVFMAGFGTIIIPQNQEIILSRGIGIRNMVDLAPFRDIMEGIWLIDGFDIKIPLFMVLVVLAFCAILAYLMNTRLGQAFKAVGEDSEKAAVLGYNVNKLRIGAMVLSMVIACIGQLLFLQNIGMLNVYTAHLNSDIFSAAALLAGGATIKKANVGNVIVGIFLFHALFIVSPQAGQNMFGNAALGEYFRSFVAYGTIAAALMFNISSNNAKKVDTYN